MSVNINDVKQLREQTLASFSDVRAALEKADGNYDDALKFLREKGLTSATKKMEREANQGIIFPYVHNHKIGVLLELNCETDFVARNEEFHKLAKNIAIQIVLHDPLYVSETDSDNISNPKEEVLLNQTFYQDPSLTVAEMLKEAIAKFGENIKVKRFTKIVLGQ